MITVLTPLDSEFELYKSHIKEIYEKYQEKICDPNSFLFVIKNTLFYAFFLDGTFIGAIYYFMENEKLFLNAFALPKNHLANLECLQLSENIGQLKIPLIEGKINGVATIKYLMNHFKIYRFLKNIRNIRIIKTFYVFYVLFSTRI